MRTKNPHKWTEEDDKFILENLGKIKRADFHKIIGCSRSTITERLRQLGHPYKPGDHMTDDMKNYIIESVDNHVPVQEIADHIGMKKSSLQALMARMRKNGMSFTYLWRDYEVEWIKDNYYKMSISKMAEKLGRSYGSVSQKCRHMGIITSQVPQEILDKAMERFPNEPTKDIAEDLCINQYAIIKEASRKGIRKSAEYINKLASKRGKEAHRKKKLQAMMNGYV